MIRIETTLLRTGSTAAVLTILMLLAGCGSSGSSSTSTSSTTAGSSSTTTPSSSTSALAPALCATEQLQVKLGQVDAGAGQIYVPIVFTNTGAKPCELRGFPGVSLLGPGDAQIGQPATRDGAEGSTVILAPNGSASSLLRTANSTGGTANCSPTASAIRIYPPDNTNALIIRTSFTACGGMSITTIVSGISGN